MRNVRDKSMIMENKWTSGLSIKKMSFHSIGSLQIRPLDIFHILFTKVLTLVLTSHFFSVESSY
jgi:hypothetical protein